MARSLLIFVMVAALILPFAITAIAQPDPQFGNWELGIEYPQEDRDNPFILSEGGMTSVTFFVDNMGLLDIKVSFEYDIPFNGQFSGPEDASVSAGSNDSFMMLITGIDVYQHSAGSKEAFTISANLEERAGMPVIFPESQEKNGDLEIPEIHELHVDITDAVGPINAGTDSIYQIHQPERWLAAVEAKKHGTAKRQALTPDERAEEILMTGLRLTEGVNQDQFRALTGLELGDRLDPGGLEKMVEGGFLVSDDVGVRVTTTGRLCLNEVLRQLLVA